MDIKCYEDEVLEIQCTIAEAAAMDFRALLYDNTPDAVRLQVTRYASGNAHVTVYLADDDERYIDFRNVDYVVTGRFQDDRDRAQAWEQGDILAYIIKFGVAQP